MTYTSATKRCGTDHTKWIQTLGFFKDEITVLTKRLEEITRKNTAKDVMSGTEHFQNQFLIQEKNIHSLTHEIRAHEKRVVEQISGHAGKISSAEAAEHERLHAQTIELEAIIDKLRQEFKRFAAKWM